MNPYSSIWTGVAPGDGPEAFSSRPAGQRADEVLADAVSGETLDGIRCGACLNACLLQLEGRAKRRFGARRDHAFDGVNDQIEPFEYELTEQRLTSRRSHEAVGIHLSIPKRKGQETGAREFDRFLGGERDDDLAVERQSQRLDDILRQKRHDGARIDESVELHATNPSAVQVARVGEDAVALILENQPGAYFTHRRLLGG